MWECAIGFIGSVGIVRTTYPVPLRICQELVGWRSFEGSNLGVDKVVSLKGPM